MCAGCVCAGCVCAGCVCLSVFAVCVHTCVVRVCVMHVHATPSGLTHQALPSCCYYCTIAKDPSQLQITIAMRR